MLIANAFGNLLIDAYRSYDQFTPASWGLSELLINYQGGFVRRGLLGEIFFQVCEPFHWDPRWLIIPLVITACVLTTVWLIRIFRQNCLCLWFLPTMFGLFGMHFVRKDFLMLLVLILALHLYTVICRPAVRITVVSLLLLFVLNVHEASFLIAGPLWMLIVLFDRGLPYRLWCRLCICVPPVLMFAILCIFKGQVATAEAIWHSWESIYPYLDRIPRSIAAIGWDSTETFLIHLSYNYGDARLFHVELPYDVHIAYGGILVRPLAIMILFYLAVNLLLPRRVSREVLRKYVLILLFLFLSLLPMFTVLSCDFSRVSAYWILYSAVAFHYLRGIELRLPLSERLERFSEWVLRHTRAKKLRRPWMFFLFFHIPLWKNRLVWYTAPIICFPLMLLQVWLSR
ncbi:MAG: hypothetical protein ACI4O9_03085 [Akkermansia sp.]